jgi:hypothetical protein
MDVRGGRATFQGLVGATVRNSVAETVFDFHGPMPHPGGTFDQPSGSDWARRR